MEFLLYESGTNPDLGYPTTVRLENGSLFTLWYEKEGTVAALKYCRWRLLC